MPNFRTLDDLQVKGHRVLVRADLNVPMKDGHVTDASRIERQAPTIRELSDKGARVIVLSHFDRPKGKVVPSMSLKPISAPLSKAVGRPVTFAEDCVGHVALAAVAKLKDGDVLLLENTRFHVGEESNDPGFTKQVAALGDIFINDAFSAAHRAHATTTGLATLMPSAAGRSMERELTHLQKALGNPERPLLAIDIAVPRDIEPACREIAGVSVHDIDDVQQIVERNTSGRESEAKRAEHIIEAELDRFEHWLASLEVVPTIAALRGRGDEIVRRVLAENEGRWESLGEADRERLETMAKAIASRLLHEPTLRMRRAAGSDDAYSYVSALRELFGLDGGTEPEVESGSNVTELRKGKSA